MKTTFEEIVDLQKVGEYCKQNFNDLLALAEQENVEAANKDATKTLLLVIDDQNDFMDNGALGVPGACEDVQRLLKFIYGNFGKITSIISSLDTHRVYQIFHPCWWVDKDGNNPSPNTTITYEDIKEGKWRPLIEPVRSTNYVKELEARSKKQLCIWPYHTLEGTFGHALEGQLARMIYFHSVVRKTNNFMVSKGMDAYSEMYGIIKPEYSEKNFVNTEVLNVLEKYDKILLAGEAASHCLLESLLQILEYFKDRPEVTQKITVLIDCTSPIHGYEEATDEKFAEIEQTYGVKFVKSTDVTL